MGKSRRPHLITQKQATMKTKQTILTAILIVVAFVAIGVIGLRYNKIKFENPMIDSVQIESIDSLKGVIAKKEQIADSVAKSNKKLETKIKVLETKAKELNYKLKLKQLEYRLKTDDERVALFFSKTQDYPPTSVDIINDSVLVPIPNIDVAVSHMIELEYCDSVVMTKDSIIDLYWNMVRSQEYYSWSLDKQIDAHKAINNILEKRVDELNNQQATTNKKLKWSKIKSTAKDIAILALLIKIIV